MFIFATTEQHKIPATIISRCQRFEFRRISVASLVKRLMYIAKAEGIDLTDEGATIIARTAQGGMRDAISLMELCAGAHTKITPEHVNLVLGTSSYEKMATVAKSIANKEYSRLFETINEVVVSSKDILVFFSDLTSFYRDMMVVRSLGDASFLELPESEMKLLSESSSLFNMATLIYHANILDNAYTNMMRNPTQKRLMAEITLMKMCDPKLSDSTDSIISRLSSIEDKLALLSRGAIIPQESEPVKQESSKEEKVEKETISAKKEEKASPINDEYVDIEYWDEAVSKISEKKPMISSFISRAVAKYQPSTKKYYIQAENDIAFRMLSDSKDVIYESMLISEISINSSSQIEIFAKRQQAVQKNGLEEF